MPGRDLKEILALLHRQIRLIGVTLVLILSLALLYVMSVTPVYQATALVLVDPAQKNLLLERVESSNTSAASDSARVESEVEILRADATLLAMIEAEGLIADPDFGPRLGLRDKLREVLGIAPREADGARLVAGVLQQVRQSMTVRRRGLTHLVAVSVRSTSPGRAADLANALAETYIARQIAVKVDMALAGRDVLQSRIDGARDAVARSEDALDAFIDGNLAVLEAESGRPAVAALRRRMEREDAGRLASEVRMRQAEAARRAQDWAAVSERLGDAALAELSRQREALQAELGQAAGAQAVDLRTALAEIEEGLNDRADSAINALRVEIGQAEAGADDSRRQLREELLRGEVSSATLATVYELQQEAAIARQQYQTLLQRLRELEAQAAVQIADSRIVSPAMAPLYASFPNKRQVMAVALVMGLGMGVGLAFLNEFYVGGVTSTQQLRNILQLPVAAGVPVVPGAAPVADSVINAPLSPYSEAIRRIRASVDQAPAVRPGGKIILITSSIPDEGKSTTAVALARTYAMAGKTVLLIDSDLRKPAVHRLLGLVPEIGFLDYLRNPTDATATFCIRDPLSDAEVILGAGRAERPTDQSLASATFARLLEEARQAFDVVILDSPPLVPVVDTRYIAPHADAVLLVVRHGVTSQGDIRQSVSQLQEVMRPGAQLATILNHEATQPGSYRYRGYYSGYAEDPASA